MRGIRRRRRESRRLTIDTRAARILDLVRAIPKGFVQTYGDIDPHAPRLVGHVLATTNHTVPWHRVVRADGAVTQGRRQLERLRKEGVPLRGKRVDLSAARLPRGITLTMARKRKNRSLQRGEERR